MKYRLPGGGFAHSFVYDARHPDAVPGKENSIASEQALYGLVAYDRFIKGMNNFYDFRPEDAAGLSGEPKNAPAKNAAPKGGQKQEEVQEDAASGETDEVPEPAAAVFTEEDKAEFYALPETLTTEHFVSVLKLINKAEQAEDFPEKQKTLEKLYNGRQIITEIQNEIDDINKTAEGLYPFEKISAGDKPLIDSVLARYNALSEYDRRKIPRYGDILRAKARVDGLLRAAVISAVLFALIAVMGLFMILRVKKRRREKEPNALTAG
jgi:hypothetical protein